MYTHLVRVVHSQDLPQVNSARRNFGGVRGILPNAYDLCLRGHRQWGKHGLFFWVAKHSGSGYNSTERSHKAAADYHIAGCNAPHPKTKKNDKKDGGEVQMKDHTRRHNRATGSGRQLHINANALQCVFGVACLSRYIEFMTEKVTCSSPMYTSCSAIFP
jgi:hypothetical protein